MFLTAKEILAIGETPDMQWRVRVRALLRSVDREQVRTSGGIAPYVNSSRTSLVLPHVQASSGQFFELRMEPEPSVGGWIFMSGNKGAADTEPNSLALILLYRIAVDVASSGPGFGTVVEHDHLDAYLLFDRLTVEIEAAILQESDDIAEFERLSLDEAANRPLISKPGKGL